MEPVDDGVVERDGRDVTDPRVDADEVRSRIGIVFQAYKLFPHLRVLHNVTLAPRRVHGVPREQAEHEALETLAASGCWIRRDPGRMSCPVGSSSASPAPARW